jgi:trans-2,3-dihydro-3-hydroxyanthranilate isomerase
MTDGSSRSYAYETLDVFTDRLFGGNQLAVFTDAHGLSDAEMQSLAAEMNLSETSFVFPPVDATSSALVRIFHRTGEMPFAGHPTLGTGVVLARSGRFHGDTLLLEVKAGLVRVTIERDAAGVAVGGVIAAPRALTTGDDVPVAVIAECAGLHVADILTTAHAPIVASVGAPYVIAEVRSLALSMASPNLNAFRSAVAARPHFDGRMSLHLYAREETHLRARMFAPLAGTWEDPATGSANAALAALLLSRTDADHASFRIVQGVEIGRRSELTAGALRSVDGIRATVGGRCVPVASGVVRL